MTTRKPRRNKPQQARDILLALLKKQEAEVEKHKAAYEGANLRATSTRRAIELLHQAMLPGMEQVADPLPAEEGGILASPWGDIPVRDYRADATASAERDNQKAVSMSRSRRRRIGEKADVNDVWPAPELGPTNHSTLMYSRKALCLLCFQGVPYATEKRTSHYVTTGPDSEGKGKTEYKPCMGIGAKETT